MDKIFRILLAISIVWSTTPARALPEVRDVAAGDVSFDQHDSTMDITASDRSIINYNTFNIASQETVNFIQPSSTATVLNRIFQGSPSEIFGNLNANGIIFLINTSGIIFGRDTSVNVGGLIASALDIADNDFLSGNYHFLKNSGVNPAAVINEGDIRASEGGSVALVGGAVKNAGTIDAYLGSIALASGDQVTISFTPDHLISVAVDEGTSQEVIGPDGERIASGVENTGMVSANGGAVKLQAKQVLDIFDQAVNQQGIIEARSVAVRNGVVELAGEGGMVVNEGTVDVSGTDENSNAGAVDIQGKEIIHRGTILANAEDGGIAGDVKVISTDLTLLGETSRIEAKGFSGVSGGGNIIIDSTDGVTDFARGAVIDVSGGPQGGNGGFIELSGRGMILEGEVIGSAAEGYTGGTLYIDPYDIIIRNDGTDAVSGGDSSNGIPDESYSENSGSTLIFNPQSGGSFTGFNQIYLQATNNITITSSFNLPTAIGGGGSANLKLEAGNNIDANASVSTTNKAIEMYANNNITIAGNVSTTGSGILTIRADYDNSGVGAFTQSAGTTISTTGGAITVSSGGDAAIASISNGSGSLSVTSNNGSIYSQTGGSMLTASILTLTADNNIGSSSSSIGTNVTNITANSTVDGDIFLAETNGVTLNSVRTVDGAITVTAGGSVTAKDVVAGDAGNNEEHDINVSSTSGSILVGVITADDDVTLQLAGSASNINNSATVTNPTITGDQITLISGDNGRVGSWGDKIQTVSNSLQVAGGVGGVYLDERNNLTLTDANITAPMGSILDLSSEKAIMVAGNINLGTGSITLTADSDNSNTLTDTLTMNDGVTIGGTDQAGQIVLSSAGDMKLEAVQTAANITATSTLGSIINSSATGNLLSADTATLTARGSIGASDSSINTSVAKLDLSSTNNGSVFIAETNDVTLLAVDTVNGNVTITAGGAILDDSNQATVVSTTTLNLTAANGIGASGNGDIDTTVTILNANNTGTGNIHLRETNGALLSSIVAVNGTINAVSDTGNLTVGTVTSSGGQDITLQATAGSIFDDSNQATVITGNRLNATALNSIGSSGNGDLDTTVATLDLSSTGDGNIVVHETDGVNLLDLDTVDGGITVNAGGPLTVTDVVVGDAGDNAQHDVTIAASSGDITVRTLTGDDDVTLTASNGSILSNNSAIIGGLLSLTSGTNGSIGTSANRLNTTSSGFSISGGTGGVYISENNAVSLTGNPLSAGAGATIDLATKQGITVSGNIAYGAANLVLTADSDNTNNASDNFNQNDNTTINGTGNLTISSYGNVFLETVNTSGNITVASESGSITHSSSTGNLLTGNTITLTSALNIGTSGTNIKTTANTLDVSSTSSGGVFLTETDGVTLRGIDTADGLIKITTGGDTVAASVVTGDADSDNDYNVTLTVNGGNLTAETITADKNLSINVTGSILDDANQATRLTGDVVTLTAQNAIGAAGNGDIDTAANSLDISSTVSGDIVINEANDVTLLGLDTANGNIAITSGGAILDDSNQATVVSTNALSLTAANSIGSSGNEIDTTVSSLDLSVNGTGSIFVVETDGVTLTDVDTTNGSITIVTGGAATITDVQASGAGSDVAITAASGNITVTTVTAADDVTLVTSAANGSILSNNSLITGDLVSLTSGTGGAVGANGNKIQTVSNSLDVETGTGGVFLDETNNLTLTGTNVMTANGAIYDVSSEKVLIVSGNINQGNGQIILTADSDNSSNEAISWTAGTLTANAVTLTATGNIGASGAAIQTNTASLDLSSTVAGDIYLTEQDGVNLSDVDTIGGSVNITTGGSVTLTDVQAGGAGSDITIIATSGNLTTGLVTAADDVTLNAANGSLVYGSSQITGDQITLSSGAAGAIGTSGSRIQTASTSLNVTGGTGGVFLNEKNNLNLTGANVVAAPGGTFDVASEKSLTVSGSINANTGQIILTADSDNSNTATDTFTQADGTTIGGAGQSGNVTIAARGDVSLETITTTGNLSATSEAGDIKHTSNTGNLLTVDQIDLTAAGNIGTGALAIATTTGTLDASSTVAGNIYLNETDNVILRSVTAANGNVTLSSIAGSLLDDANQTTKVTGNVITLTAANAIGASGANAQVDTAAATINAASTVDGDIYIDEVNGVTLGTITTADGSINITTGGDTVISSSSVISGDANSDETQDVVISASTGNITVGTVTSDNNAFVTASAGSIFDDGLQTSRVTGNLVTLTAANDIGTSAANGEIDTAAGSLDVSSASSGNIVIGEQDGVNLLDVDTADGAITITTGGATTITDVVASDAGNDATHNVSITVSIGDITVHTLTADNNATVTASNGSILDDGGQGSRVSGNTVTLTAANAIGSAAANADIDTTAVTLNAASTIAGDVVLNETDAVILNNISAASGLVQVVTGGDATVTTIGASGNVSLTSSAGILDDANQATKITGQTVSLTAADEIGSTTVNQDIDTTAVTLNVASTTAGDVVLNETDAVTLNNISVASGSVQVSTGGDATVNTIAASQNVTLTSGAAILDDSVQATKITGQTVSLTAADEIGSTAANQDIDTTAVTLNASSTAGDVVLNETDAVALNNINAASGSVQVTTGGDATVNTVIASQDVSLTSGAAILDDGSQGTKISGNLVTLTAANAIGSGAVNADIDTAAASLDVSSTGAGDIVLNETDGVNLLDIDTADGVITITTGGATTVTDVVAADAGADQTHNVSITASSGDITVGTLTADNNASIVATDGSILSNNSAITGNLVTLTATASGKSIGENGNKIQTTSNSQAISAGSGGLYLDERNNLTLTGTNVTAASGAIFDVSSEQGITLSGDINQGIGQIFLTVDSDNNSAESISWTAGTLTADAVTLTATGNIGATGVAVQTNTATLDLSSTVAGDIYLTEQDGVNLLDVDTADGAITIAANGATMITDVAAGDTGNDAAHDVSISAGNGDVTLVTLTADNNATITASGGVIVDDSNQTTRVSANLVTLTAANAIGDAGNADIDTAATSLDVSSTSAGNVVINELDAVTLSDVDTADGAITITAGNNIVATDVMSADSGADAEHDITLTATNGNIIIGSVSADDDATLTAAAGNILDDSNQATVLSGNLATLTAQTGIGGSGNGDIDTTVNVLDISSTQSGSIFLRETDGVTLQAIDTTDGAITITTGGATTVTSIVASDAGANEDHDVSLTVSSGNVTVTTITADNDATIMASNGSILSNNSLVTGDLVTLVANNGASAIGASGNKIQTTSNTLAASAGTGGVYIDETNNLNLDGANVTTASGGTFDVSSEKALTVTDGINQGSGEIILTADSDNSNTATDTFTQNDGATIGGVGQSGNITIAARGGVLLETITTTGNITATSEAGAIQHTSNTGNLLTADQITLNAGGTVGTGASPTIKTTANTISATATAAGNILIDETDGVTFQTVTTTDGFITLNSGDDTTLVQLAAGDADSNSEHDITVTASSGNISAVGTVTSDDDITFTASGGSILDDSNQVTVISGDLLTMTAQGSIGAGGNGDIDTTVNTINASSAGSGDILLRETDGVTLNSITTADGAINITTGGATLAANIVASDAGAPSEHDIALTASSGNITVGTITADDDASITATGGSILDDSNQTTRISGDVVTLSAGGAIGGSGNADIETTAVTLNASTTVAGDITINEFDNISLANITTNDGAINLTANGLVLATNLVSGDADNNSKNDITVITASSNISVGTITSDDDVILQAAAGNIVDDGTQNTFITGNRITLTAEQEIGASGSGDVDTKANAFDVSSTGTGNIFLNEFDGVDLADIDTADGTITITTGGDTTITDVVTADAGNDDNHDITVTAAAGNLTVVSATSDNNIVLNASAGSILDDSNQATRLTGSLLNLTAANSVGASGNGDLDTAAASLNVSSTTSGDIFINETDSVTLADVDTADGAITVTAGNNIVATNVVSGDSDTNSENDTTLTANAGSIMIGTVTSDDDATLTAAAGNINDDSNQGTSVSGDLVTLTAQNGIGSSVANAEIDTTATTLNVSSTQSGSIFLRETNGVTLQNVSTADGGITITTGGATTVTNMTAADAGANEEHDVNLTVSSGNITITTVTADDDATITASNGSIFSNNSMVIGDVVTLSASNGVSSIGASGNKIQTTSNSLSVSSGTGGVFLNEKNNLNLAGNVAAAGGDFDVSSEKAITVSGDINVGSGAMTLTADSDNSDTSTDTFTQADGTTLGGVGQSGQITINARGNVSLETIATSGNLAALSEAGAITHTSNSGNLLTANQITLTSDSGIGTGGLSMATTTGTLDLSVTGNGGIFINETDGVNLLDLDTAGGTITVMTGGAVVVTDVQAAGTGSDISITANSGNMTLSTVTAADDVTLLTTDANSSILSNNSIITGDLVSLTSGTNGSIGANGNKIQTTSNSLDVEAGSGGVFLDETNNLTITSGNILTAANSTFDVSSEKAITVSGNINVGNGQVILTADSDNSNDATDTFTQADGRNITGGQIDITARGDISLETITTSQNVTITSAAGAITHTSSTGNMINGDLVTLTANGSIGTDTLAIATAANSLNVSSTGTGNIYLSETDGVDLADLDTINGSITVTTGGATTVTDIQAAGAGSDVTITNTTGDMTVATINAADDVTLTAATGSVLDDGAATAITGDLVDITAQNGIGAGGNEVDTTAASLNLSVTGTGNIFVNEIDAATLSDVDTANGNITIQTGGAATVSDVQASGAGSDISITATTGNMTVTTITAAGDVTLVTSAANGSIPSNNSTITGDLVTLTSGSSGAVGASGNKIQTTSTSLDVDAGSGGVYLDETNNLTLDGTNVTAASGATFDVSSEGTLMINGNINQGTGQILLTADSDSNSNEDISWTSGTLTTSDKITLTATGDIGAAGAAIRTSAGSLDISSTVRGNIVINDVDATATELDLADLDTADGSITITTANLVRASDVRSMDAGNNETHNVSITAANGNITVHTLIADGNVLLDAQNGSVIFNSVVVQGEQVTLTSSATGSVGTADNPVLTKSGVSEGNAWLDIRGGSGGIFLTEQNPMDIDGGRVNIRTAQSDGTPITDAPLNIGSWSDITVSTNLNQGSGAITLTADADNIGNEALTIADGILIGGTSPAQSGAVTLLAGGDIIIETEDASFIDTTGNVSITSTNGSILPQADGAVITGNVVTLTAAGNIGEEGQRIQTQANQLNLNITGSGTLFLQNSGTLTLTDMTAANGVIDLISDTIVDDGLQTTMLVAGTIRLQATNGIGAAGNFDIDTQSSNITLTNTGAGNIFLHEVDGATLTSITVNDGTISAVSDTGNLSIGTITSTNNQSITLTATAGSILDSNSQITTNGAIGLTSAANGSIGTSAAAIQTISSSNLTLSGGTGVFVDERNDLNLNGSSVTVADGGNIDLSSEESIVLSGVLSAQNGNVTLTADSNNDSTSETITQNAGASISGNLVTLTADAGIGTSATAIQTSAVSLDASVTEAGDLFINEADAVTLIAVDTANGSLDIRNASGDMTVTTVTATGGNATLVAQAANGSILSDNSTITANTVTLTSGASGSIGASDNKIQTVASTHNIAAGSGGVFLDERNNLTLTGANITAANGATFDVSSEQSLTVNGNINQGTGAITLTSDSNNNNPGAPFNSAFDTFTQADGTTIGGFGQSGNITLTSRGDMQLETVTTSGDLNIISEVGTLTHTSSTGNRLTADDISLRAHGIGTSAQAIVTAANSINAEATSTADIFLSELDNVTLNDFDTADGAVNITTGGATTVNSVIANGTGKNVSITATSGDITVNEVKASGDTVTLSASNGSILDDGSNAATSIITASNVTLTAANNIGASGNEVDTAASQLNLTTTNGNIFITETDAVTLTNVQANGAGSDVTITNTTDNMTIATVSAADDVNLTATNGAIVDDNNNATAITGDLVALTAKNGIGSNGNEVDTDAASLDLSVTAAGDIFVNENNAVTLADLDTANGSITIQTGGAATITDIQASGAGNDISVTVASGDIATGLVTAADDVTLTATNGSVLYGASVVTGDLVTLTSGASGSIGASGNKIQTTSITLAVSAGTGGVYLDETNELTLTGANITAANGGTFDVSSEQSLTVAADINQGTGAILLTADSDNTNGATENFTQNAGVTIGGAGQSGDISIATPNNAALGTVVTSGNLTVTAESGSITHSSATALTGNTVTLTAGGNIGVTGAAINTAAATLDVSSTNRGSVVIDEADGVTLQAIDTADGEINITMGGNTTVGNVTSQDTGNDEEHDVTITASNGDITVGTARADDDVTLDAQHGSILSNNSNVTGDVVTLKAFNNGTSIGSSGNKVQTTSNTLIANAGTAGVFIDETNNLILDGTNVTAVAGTFDVSSEKSLSVATSINRGTGSIILAADSDNSNTAANITDVFTQNDGVTIGGANQSGAISITAPGDVNLKTVQTTGDLTATSRFGAITHTSSISNQLTGNNVSLTAGTSIGSSATPVMTTASSLNLSSTIGGDIFVTEADGAMVNSAATADGNIQITSTTGDLTINAVNSGSKDVTLTASAGSILDDSAQSTRVAGNKVALTAPNAVGGAGNADMDTAAATLEINSTSSGNISVNELDAVTLRNISAASGNVTITNASGEMTVNTVKGQAINLTAATGSILDGNGIANNLIGTLASSLKAGGTIGKFSDPLEVNFTSGSLSVAASGSTDFFSVVINGTVPGNTLSIEPNIPGYVWFNGDIVGGQLKTQVTTEITIAMSEVTNAANMPAVASLSPMLASSVITPTFFALATPEIDTEPVVTALASAKEFGVGPIMVAAARPAVSPATAPVLAQLPPEIAGEKQPKAAQVTPAVERPIIQLNLGNIRPLPVSNVQIAKPTAVPGMVSLDLQLPTMVMPPVSLVTENAPAAEVLPGRVNPPLEEMLRQLLPTVEIPQGQLLPLLSARGLTYIRGGNATAAAGQPFELDIERILEKIRENQKE